MSNRSKAEYPSETLQKTLALLIAEGGGLSEVVLEDLCDANPTILGWPASDRCRGIQFKVRDWKEKPHTFDAVLIRAGASTLLSPAVDNANTTAKAPEPSTPPFVPKTMLSSRMSTRSQSRSPIRSPSMVPTPARSLSLSPPRSSVLQSWIDGEAPPACAAPTIAFGMLTLSLMLQ